MIEKKPEILLKGYARDIIGFDCRVLPSVEQKTDTLLGSWLHRPAIRMTYEDLVWQKGFDDDLYYGITNGMRLFNNISDMSDGLLHEQLVLAAFDMPSLYAVPLSERMFGINLTPFTYLKENGKYEFVFCGFDICTVESWHSYFYSSDTEMESIDEVRKKYSFNFNVWGLIEDEETAIRLAECFRKEWDEDRHQRGKGLCDDPFVPCGVWLEKTGYEMALYKLQN